MQRSIRAVLATVVLTFALAPTAAAQYSYPDPNTVAKELRDAVTVSGVRSHQQALQNIANMNGGTRASGTPGYAASLAYVKSRLERAGYKPKVQPFAFKTFAELADATFERISPDPHVYVPGDEFLIMSYSGSGDVTAPVTPVDLVLPPGAAANTSSSGCEAADFENFPDGNVALMQRGTCPFAVKAENAQAAGASAAVIFNEGQPGRQETLAGTLGENTTATIPVIGVSFAVGEELAGMPGAVVHITTSTLITPNTSSNLIADLAPRRERTTAKTVVVGAHLDSVPEGPGINDNGSGTAAILEIAEEMAEFGRRAPENRVRFAFWGAEEAGLVGSTRYVAALTEAEAAKIGLNLNFDMLGSPNFVRFVYDGDGSAFPTAGPRPPGSDDIERTFVSYFASQGLVTDPTAFDGRSDYKPFIDAGIPAGGLFSGAEGEKTVAQQARYGGTAGAPYDPCYHDACDTFANNNNTVLGQFAKGAAHATAIYATRDRQLPGVQTQVRARSSSGRSTTGLGHSGDQR